MLDAEVEEEYQQGYDQYAPQAYEQSGYADDQYGYAQDGYQQDEYGQDQYGQYPQQGYDQSGYADEQYGRQDYQETGYQGYQDGYGADQYGRQAEEAPAGHPYAPEPPALPAAESTPTLPSGLPQRRPGQQLASGGFGAQAAPAGTGSTGETPNWFAGAKDSSAADEPRGHDVSALGGYGPTGPTNSPGSRPTTAPGSGPSRPANPPPAAPPGRACRGACPSRTWWPGTPSPLRRKGRRSPAAPRRSAAGSPTCAAVWSRAAVPVTPEASGSTPIR